MKKLLLVPLAVLLATGLGDGQAGQDTAKPDLGGLVLSAITVLPPTGSGCTYRWRITVGNTGKESVNDPMISVNASQGDPSGGWQPAGGKALGSLAAGAVKDLELTFKRLAGKTLFKATIYRSSAPVIESIVALPLEGNPSILIEDCALTANGYRTTIRNTASSGISDLTIQGYAGSNPDAAAWSGAGGMKIPCLEGGRAYNHTGLRPGESKVIKIQASLGSTLLAERVFDLR
jgi:hypothetical protein